jgi:hypothetical protein
MVLLIIEYRPQDVVKAALSGRDFQSPAERSDARRRPLEEHGHAILILRLKGRLVIK